MGAFRATVSKPAGVDPAADGPAATTSPVPHGPGPAFAPSSGDEIADSFQDGAVRARAGGETAAKRPLPALRATPAHWERRHSVRTTPAPGTRSHERRWRDAPLIFVERRRGNLWKFGSIGLCVALWIEVWLLFRT